MRRRSADVGTDFAPGHTGPDDVMALDDVDENTYKGGEDVSDKAQADTAAEADQDARKPDTTSPDPGQSEDSEYDGGFKASSKVFARVVMEPGNKSVVGSRVFLKAAGMPAPYVGRVRATVGKRFWVDWADGQSTIENKHDYALTRR